jgi:hypothetical protein
MEKSNQYGKLVLTGVGLQGRRDVRGDAAARASSMTTGGGDTWPERWGRGIGAEGEARVATIKHGGLYWCMVSFHRIRWSSWADGRQPAAPSSGTRGWRRDHARQIRESSARSWRDGGLHAKERKLMSGSSTSYPLHPFTIRRTMAVVCRFSPISGFHLILRLYV